MRTYADVDISDRETRMDFFHPTHRKLYYLLTGFNGFRFRLHSSVTSKILIGARVQDRNG